jgi:hypothetical protein
MSRRDVRATARVRAVRVEDDLEPILRTFGRKSSEALFNSAMADAASSTMRKPARIDGPFCRL